jgi:hypothetical protein
MQHMDSNTPRDLPVAFKLASGNHESFDDGACLMEAVAYDAVEWGDLATKLRGIPPIVDVESARAARVLVLEVRDEAYKRKAAAAADVDVDAAAAYAAYAAAAKRTRLARRKVVEASIAAFARAIEVR